MTRRDGCTCDKTAIGHAEGCLVRPMTDPRTTVAGLIRAVDDVLAQAEHSLDSPLMRYDLENLRQARALLP